MAAAVLKYQVWCVTDNKWETVYLPDTDPAPTVCPANNTHTIDAALTSFTNYVASSDVDLTNVPTTSDGRLIISPAVFSGDQNLNYPGISDDISGGNRGGGLRFIVDASVDTPDATTKDITKTWQFIDHTYVQGGEAEFANGDKTDHVTMEVFAPATTVAANTGLGDCNLTATGLGYNILTPAAGDGSHDVSVGDALNANLAAKTFGVPALVSKAIPVPAIKAVNGVDTPDGYWNYDMTTGVITAAMGALGEKQGYWNLFDAEIILTRWVTEISTWDLGKGGVRGQKYRVPVKAKKVLAQWKYRAIWHVEGASPTFVASWELYTARVYTT